MQVPRKRLPIVGLLGLILVAAAGGGIYYYQFVLSHAAPNLTGVHRLIFMNATIVESSPNGKGFWIAQTAFLNQSTLPAVDPTNGLNLTSVAHTNYKGNPDNSTINASAGDILTLIIFSKSEPSPPQFGGIPGHGFDVSPTPDSVVGQLPGTLFFGKYYTVTFTVFAKGTYVYSCNIFCSNGHLSMKGNIVVG